MDPLVFAVTWQRNTEPIGVRLAELVQAVADAASLRVMPRVALSYAELERILRERLADVAWLPPITYLTLADAGTVAPVASPARGVSASYESVLLVRASEAIADVAALQGRSVGWVDPGSAAGYVLPRVELHRRGADPRTLFAEERFYGSHDAAVRALLEEKVDATATFAQIDAAGALVRGGFSNIVGAREGVRVVARFGPIPTDVIAAHTSVAEATRAAIASALERISRDPKWAGALTHVFGVDEIRAGLPASYDALRVALDEGRRAGVLPSI